MKKFERVDVFRVVGPQFKDYSVCSETLYVCRGAAVNSSKWFKNGDYVIKQETLVKTQDTKPETVCRAFDEKLDKMTDWYSSSEEAEEAAKSEGFTDIEFQTGYLNTEIIAPLQDEFEVYFSLDSKGRPFARIHAHPETEGFAGNGKVFFPDRSFIGVDVGEAIVSISKEFDTYGFLKGRMIPYEMPDMKEFLDWAWEKKDSDTKVFFVNHPGRGKYIAIEGTFEATSNKRLPIRITERKYDWAPFQNIWEGSPFEETVLRDVEKYTERTCSLTQLYLEDAWEMDVDLDDVLSKFDDTDDLFSGPNLWTRSIKFWGEPIERACKKGFLVPYCVKGHNIEALEVVPEYLDVLSHFTYEEVCNMAKEVNRINSDAINRLKSWSRKGKI